MFKALCSAWGTLRKRQSLRHNPHYNAKAEHGLHSSQKLSLLTKQARTVAEIANVILPANLPYIGKMAFAHKAGMHIDALNKRPGAFEHIKPEIVGNKRRILLSELSGRSAVLKKLSVIAPELTKDAEITGALTDRLKELEAEGYQFEGADASFELLVQRELGNLNEYFTLENSR